MKLPSTLRDQCSKWLLLYGWILVEGGVVVLRLAGRADPQVQTRALCVAAGGAGMRAASHGRSPSRDEQALPWKGWEVGELGPNTATEANHDRPKSFGPITVPTIPAN